MSFLAWELRPATIHELGLETTLENFANERSKQFETPVDLKLILAPKKRLASPLEINLYRIVQEAMNNIAKYADATNVNVALISADNFVSLIVEDDGIGFDPNQTNGDDKGLGLSKSASERR